MRCSCFGARIAIVIYFKVHYKQRRGLVSLDGIVRLAQGMNVSLAQLRNARKLNVRSRVKCSNIHTRMRAF